MFGLVADASHAISYIQERTRIPAILLFRHPTNFSKTAAPAGAGRTSPSMPPCAIRSNANGTCPHLAPVELEPEGRCLKWMS